MSVKSIIDYYNPAGIQVGDIVILNEKKPQNCEGERIAEPYTRLRVKTLQVESHGIYAKLETEQETISLTGAVAIDRIDLQDQPILQQADAWVKSTEAARTLAQKKSKVFGKLNSNQLNGVVVLLNLSILITAICWGVLSRSTSMPSTPKDIIAPILGAMLGVLLSIPFFHKISIMEEAQEKSEDLEVRLRLYWQANPGHTNASEVSCVQEKVITSTTHGKYIDFNEDD